MAKSPSATQLTLQPILESGNASKPASIWPAAITYLITFMIPYLLMQKAIVAHAADMSLATTNFQLIFLVLFVVGIIALIAIFAIAAAVALLVFYRQNARFVNVAEYAKLKKVSFSLVAAYYIIAMLFKFSTPHATLAATAPSTKLTFSVMALIGTLIALAFWNYCIKKTYDFSFVQLHKSI